MSTYKHSVSLDASKCKGCTTCLKRCPTEAIRIRDGRAVINSKRCIDCGECIRVCPHKAKKAIHDSFSDLAVICISAYGLTPARFSDGNELTPGCKVAAYCGGEVTGGTVFATQSRLTIGDKNYPMLKTSAATGNTAGSLWGPKGQVVGIISPRISLFLHDSEEETAFVIPSITVKQIVDQLLQQGFVSGRPSLGARVEEVTPIHQNYWQLPEGLRITHSTNPALLDGDILVSLQESTVHTIDDLYEMLFACRVGQSCRAQVYRDGYLVDVSLTLLEEGKD